jgi:CDP-glucose 4,6-dehydratase
MVNRWKDKTVFVTGGSGFVGANLISRVLGLGARVVCLERDRTFPNSLDVLGLREQINVVTGSVEDLALMNRVITEYQPETVFHLAAQAIVGSANRSPFPTFEANIRGTYILLEACRTSPSVSEIVVASSDKAYGTHAELPYREDFELCGTFPYDVSKSCADMIARSFAKTYGMGVAVTRSANIYGPADVNLSRIIPGTMVSVLRGEDPVVRSDGTPIREFIHVDDVVSGYLTLAENIDKISGEAFNFGTNSPLQIIDLVNQIIRLAGAEDKVRPNVLLESKIEHEIDAQYLSAEKIGKLLDWKPTIGLEYGMGETLKWYRENLKYFG